LFEKLRSRMKSRYEYVRERDRRWILGIPVEKLEGYARPLLGPFLVLNLLDVVTTLTAMQFAAFRELNPLAATLFDLSLGGFTAALALKCSPALALGYIAFVRDNRNRHPLAIRMAKLSAVIVLVAGNVFYVYVVGSNLGNLLRLYF